MLTEGHHARGFELPKIARWLSEAASRRFRLNSKGRLKVGLDADLVMVEVASDHVLSEEDLLYRWRDSPYLGKRLRGRVIRTLVRGQTVFESGKASSRPAGRLLTPAEIVPRPMAGEGSSASERLSDATTTRSVA